MENVPLYREVTLQKKSWGCCAEYSDISAGYRIRIWLAGYTWSHRKRWHIRLESGWVCIWTGRIPNIKKGRMSGPYRILSGWIPDISWIDWISKYKKITHIRLGIYCNWTGRIQKIREGRISVRITNLTSRIPNIRKGRMSSCIVKQTLFACSNYLLFLWLLKNVEENVVKWKSLFFSLNTYFHSSVLSLQNPFEQRKSTNILYESETRQCRFLVYSTLRCHIFFFLTAFELVTAASAVGCASMQWATTHTEEYEKVGRSKNTVKK